MYLYTGGAYQGKLALIRKLLPEDSIRFCQADSPVLPLSGRAICGLHIWIRAALNANRSPLEEIRAALPRLRETYILCDHLGSGIVPLQPEDRRWREETGRVLQLLAGEADEVVEVLAGIPRRILLRQEILLLRHGMTADGLAHRYCGSSDPPLCPEGEAALSPLPLPERCFSSPSRRAVQSAARFFPGLQPELLPELAECHFGAFEGHTYEELKDRPDYQTWILDQTNQAAPPDGESRAQHRRRSMQGWDALLRASGSAHRIAAVSHGGTIVQIMDSLFPGTRDFYQWQPSCGQGWSIRLENGSPVSCSPFPEKPSGANLT